MSSKMVVFLSCPQLREKEPDEGGVIVNLEEQILLIRHAQLYFYFIPNPTQYFLNISLHTHTHIHTFSTSTYDIFMDQKALYVETYPLSSKRLFSVELTLFYPIKKFYQALYLTYISWVLDAWNFKKIILFSNMFWIIIFSDLSIVCIYLMSKVCHLSPQRICRSLDFMGVAFLNEGNEVLLITFLAE